MGKSFFTVILLMFISAWGHAQKQNLFGQFKIEQWNTKNGMPVDLILTMYQGKDGFLWLTTYSGLTRFDGINFVSFNSRTLPLLKTDVMESSLTETDDSTLWIPTPNSGLLAYKSSRFTRYLAKSNSFRYIAETVDHELLMNTNIKNASFILFDTKSKKFTDISDTLRKQLYMKGRILPYHNIDKSGTYWLVWNGKLQSIKDGKLHELGIQENVRPDIVYHTLYADKQGRVWCSSDKGLFLWNGKAMAPYPGMEDRAFVRNAFTSGLLLEDRKGGIWAATSKGLAYLAPNAERFVFIPGNYPLNPLAITNLLEDREGNIWVSAETGIYKLSYSKFANYSVKDGLPDNRVSGVCVAGVNKYMVAPTGQLFWVEDGLVRPYVFKNKAVESNVKEVYHLNKDSGGNIWVCTDKKIIEITSNGEKIFAANDRVSFSFEDAEKKMWFAISYNGIAFINQKEELEFLHFPGVDFSLLFISSIRKLHNGSWLITMYNKGFMVIDTTGKPAYFNQLAGSADVGVFSSYEDDDGTIWLPTQSGLSRFKDGKLSSIGFRDGLPVNAVMGFLPDHEGYIWFATNIGLLRAKKQELNDYLDKKTKSIQWKFFDEGDGMINQQCVGARHGASTPDGKLLVPTFGGLLEINPAALFTNPVLPPVVVHHVSMDDSTVDLSKENIFKPGNHRYIFQYSAPSLTAPGKVQIKFRLMGYDKDWITSVGDRRAFYTNIPSGTYTFRVIASNNDGLWNETGAGFTFAIQPFFYETAWFWILITLLLLALVWTIIRWRTRAVQKQNELLEGQVTARTKDLNKANMELNESNAAIATQRDSLEKTLVELKSTQSQLIQSEKMASLGELTAGIAHEIQNPLNFVNNFSDVNAELIDEAGQEIDKGNIAGAKAILNDIKENEQKINHHGKRADAIVKGMLQHSQKSSGQKEPTDINKLADEYLRLAYRGLRAKEKDLNATIKTDFDESIGTVNIIPQDIGRVLLNLYNNAFYAVREKSGLKDLTSLYESLVSVTTKKISNRIEIYVADNGGGIPQNIVDKIFQPFFTTKPTGQGTGLGLSLAYDIVKAHGGELKVNTKENEGTTFIIELPAV